MLLGQAMNQKRDEKSPPEELTKFLRKKHNEQDDEVLIAPCFVMIDLFFEPSYPFTSNNDSDITTWKYIYVYKSFGYWRFYSLVIS